MRLIRLLKKDLAQEVSSWVDERLISKDQARSICQRYDVDFDDIQNQSGAYGLLLSLAYLFIGLALITLLSANWEEIPRAVRMGGLLTITMATHALALRFYLEGKEPRAVALFFLGNLFYGASIILIAQIYHLGEHMPDGVFWWALGSLPFALLLRNQWLMLFSLLLALLWFMMEYSMGFPSHLFPLFLIAALVVLIKGQTSTLLFLMTVVSIVLWFEALLSQLWSLHDDRFDLYEEHLFISISLFIFAYAVSLFLHARDSSKSKDYGALLSLWSLRFALLFLLVMGFESPWKELIRSDWLHQSSMWPLMALLLSASLWFGWKAGHVQTLLVVSFCSVATMLAVVLSNDSFHAIYFQIITNVSLISVGIWLILQGVQQGVSHYFFLGIATILLTASMRYIDLIGDYIGASILFMLLAFLLIGAARFWKSQQQGASA